MHVLEKLEASTPLKNSSLVGSRTSLWEPPLRRDSGTGSEGPGCGRAAARTGGGRTGVRGRPASVIDAHLRAQTPTTANRADPKARSDALLPTPFEGVGGRANTPLTKPSGTPRWRSGFITYRLRNPAAATAALRPNRVAAAILFDCAGGRRVAQFAKPRSPAQAQEQAHALAGRVRQALWRAHSTGCRRRCCGWAGMCWRLAVSCVSVGQGGKKRNTSVKHAGLCSQERGCTLLFSTSWVLLLHQQILGKNAVPQA